MKQKAEITVTDIIPSAVCPDSDGAIDATVSVGDVTGEVTLVRDWSTGELSSWGELSDWASESLHSLSREMLEEIVAEVALAAAGGAL